MRLAHYPVRYRVPTNPGLDIKALLSECLPLLSQPCAIIHFTDDTPWTATWQAGGGTLVGKGDT